MIDLKTNKTRRTLITIIGFILMIVFQYLYRVDMISRTPAIILSILGLTISAIASFSNIKK